MAGLRELLSKEGFSLVLSKASSLHSITSLCALVAASAAASSVNLFPIYVPDSHHRGQVFSIARCEGFHDEGVDFDATILKDDGIQYADKPYEISLKSIYSAFYPWQLSLTVSRALLVNFQPIVEALASQWKTQDEDEDEFEEEEELARIDYRGALVGTGWTVLRELTVVTTRRLLERFVVRHVSKRTAWKLLKDIPLSSQRKAGRRLLTSELLIAVTKTTFRAQLLGIAAGWLVQLLVDIFFCIRALYRRRRKLPAGSTVWFSQIEREELVFLIRKTVGNTLKCGASLLLASIGSGLGVVLISSNWGQRIGCALGELLGGVAMSHVIDPWIVFGTFGFPDVD